MNLPDVLRGPTQKIYVGCGSLFLTINCDQEGKPLQVIGRLGKAGGCQADQIEAIGRLITIGLAHGAPLHVLARTLIGMRCPQPIWHSGELVQSCADGIAQGIRRWMEAQGMAEAKLIATNSNSNGGTQKCA